MVSLARRVFVCAPVALLLVIVAACSPEAHKDAGVPCAHDRECDPAEGLSCLPYRNGVSGGCLEPTCTKKCETDADCVGLRKSGDGKECFICKDTSDCRHVSTAEGGASKSCVDRCSVATSS